MDSKKYVDKNAILQVIGNIYQHNELLDNDSYTFVEEDIPDKFHRVVFGAIYNLFQQGVEKIDLVTINDYLKSKESWYTIYKQGKGDEWLTEVSEISSLNTFQYYYNRMKKMTLLRMYASTGMDLSEWYDIDNILDVKKKQEQDVWLDNISLSDMAELINDKIEMIKMTYAEGGTEDAVAAAEGLDELLLELKKNPEFGIPLYGRFINTIFRGARLKKVFLRSASTGTGKSRAMIADACMFACEKIYDINTHKWIYVGPPAPTLFISTEQTIDEIQTMLISFIANVDEAKILEARCNLEEYTRVKEAVKILKESPLYIKELPDFSLSDIEKTIKKEIRNKKISYLLFDYIHSSMKILSEVTSKAGVKGLREDNVLFMISVKLKDLANQYNIFIMTATQLNGDYSTAKVYDQNLLRGAKAIGDKVDAGMIMLDVTEEDLLKLEEVLSKGGYQIPNTKIAIYKNRRGKHKGTILWCVSDKSTCRVVNPIFATDGKFKLIEIEDTNICVKE